MWSKCACLRAASFSINARFATFVIAAAIAGVPNALAQNPTFTSGSTGADGALSFTTAGTFYFDPSTIPNHQAGDTIFNFTTITIASGVTVRLDSRNLPGPVYWLASQGVEIDGTLDLTGLPGHSRNSGTDLSTRSYSTPGAGGFGGGPGGGSATSAEDGAGPGGGKVPALQGGSNIGAGGTFSGSHYLIPLIGGSGASGVTCAGIPFSGGGGAGGGAVLIASSASIAVAGTVTADGGDGPGDAACYGHGAGGSGGAIRLIAPTISVTGKLSALGGDFFGSNTGPEVGSKGYIRLETFQLTCSNCTNGTPYTASSPNNIALPVAPLSTVKVTSVAGISINANPFSFPDAVINSTSPVPVVIAAQGVPPGAIPTLYIISESGADQVAIAAPALAGTVQSSTSTVNITFPPNGSKGLVRVTWSQ